MRILMISAEAPPLHRAGALVDVLDALPRELRERGHEVSVILPFYREIRENSLVEINDTGVTVDIRVGEKNYVAEYFEGRTSSGVQLFFVRCDEFFDRPEIYGEHGQRYDDNASRFVFFCKAAVELARKIRYCWASPARRSAAAARRARTAGRNRKPCKSRRLPCWTVRRSKN